MPTLTRRLMFTVHLLLYPVVCLAQADGHGPDAWQVIGVAPNDTLNVRTGPGTDHLVIDAFASDATGMQMVTCVPFLTRQKYQELTDSQRAGLPARWCLMESLDRQTKGWVSAHYLQEDTSGAQPNMDPLVAEAIALVRHVYALRQSAQNDGAIGPLHPSVAPKFFFPDAVARLEQGSVGADPLFGTQDTQISGLNIFAPAERAMFRGMVTVHAAFRNFGQPQQSVFRLRVDGALDNPALRILQIEHDGWVFP